MFAKDCMTRHPIMISVSQGVMEAQKIMSENSVKHLPVVGDGKRLLGLITRSHLSLKPDILSSLNVWEISRYLTSLSVKDVMIKAKNVYSVSPDCAVERAAKIITDRQIGCLPVLEEGVVLGILTRVDLLHSYQEMLGLPVPGMRVTIRMPDHPGEFVKLMSALVDQRWGIMGIGTFPDHREPGYYMAVIKIPGVEIQQVRAILSMIPGHEIIDIRASV